jgi:hypothetical protein
MPVPLPVTTATLSLSRIRPPAIRYASGTRVDCQAVIRQPSPPLA